MSPGLACGPLLRNHNEAAPSTAEGAVLLAEHAVPEDLPRILASAATITQTAALLSHVSLFSREFGRPSVALGVSHRARLLPAGSRGCLDLGDGSIVDEGSIVLVDGDLGLVEVPGGAHPEARRAIRTARARLRDPEARLRASTLLSEFPPPLRLPVVAFLVDAVAGHGVIEDADGALAFLDDLGAHPDAGPSVASRGRVIAERSVSRFDRTAASIDRALDSVEDPEELDGLRARLDRALAREKSIVAMCGRTWGSRLEALARPVA